MLLELELHAAVRAKPLPFRRFCEADTLIMKPLDGAVTVVACNHVAEEDLPAFAINRLVGVHAHVLVPSVVVAVPFPILRDQR